MITYREFDSARIDEVYRIYEENGWKSYLGDKDRLSRAFDRSLFVLGAFDGEELAGFVRCIGDSEYILYVQDLIVRPAYQRKGIGRELMRQVLEKYASVRQFVLITDKDDDVSNAFYREIGLSDLCNGYPINAYFRGKEKAGTENG